MHNLVKTASGAIIWLAQQVHIHTRNWNEDTWIIVMFCAFVFGCFTVNDCSKRKRL